MTIARYILILILGSIVTGCAGVAFVLIPQPELPFLRALTPNLDPAPTHFCHSLNEYLLEPIRIEVRKSPKHMFAYRISAIEPMKSKTKEHAKGDLGPCFLPDGIKRETFELALANTLKRAGFPSVAFSYNQPNLILDVSIMRQEEDISDHTNPELKMTQLVVNYKLLHPDALSEIWSKTVTTQHSYGVPNNEEEGFVDTITTAFQAAMRENLEILLKQLDEYEKNHE
jgi:hypothetical protein